jgi:hypothetical protein
MKRFLSLIVILLPVLLAPLACGKHPIYPITIPTPTYTPTFTSTPVLTATATSSCGFTSIAYPTIPDPMIYRTTSGNYVIQNAAQWAAENPTVTAPSIDFSKQMLLEISQLETIDCGCTAVLASIISVCYYSDHIEVDYSNSGSNCPPTPFTCNSLLILPVRVLAAVPQSGLPVVWAAH